MEKKHRNNRPAEAVPKGEPVQGARIFERFQDFNSPLFRLLQSFPAQAVIVGSLALVLYINTLNNEFALDDNAIIVRNEFVHQGFAGIPGIMSRDAYYSYYKQLNSSDQLLAGRYRPLSIVSFAIEQQLMGAAISPGATDSVVQYGTAYGMKEHYEQQLLHQMHVRHLVNTFIYVLLVVVVLIFLRTVVFEGAPLAALIATILFAIHPLHTEVVANVKSRDELFSLLFICLAFIASFKYASEGKPAKLWVAVLYFLLALLSKEYAVSLLVLLPAAWMLFKKIPFRKIVVWMIPFWVVFGSYLLLRWQLAGARNELSDNDIQINPYAYASSSEKLASEIATLMRYLRLLVFPHPLSSDYSYNQIPYSSFGDLMVWLSLVVHMGLGTLAVAYRKARPVLSFAILWYLVHLALVSNLLVDIGATMGERLIFHSSVGFAIAVGYLLVLILGAVQQARARDYAFLGIVGTLVVLGGYKTINRNKDWKNDETLAFKDIEVSPRSFLLNVNVAAMLVNKSDFETDERKRKEELHRGVALFTRVLGMQDNYVLGYLNRSIAWLKLEEPDSMKRDLDRILELYPIHPVLPEMLYHEGVLYQQQHKLAQADSALRQSLRLNPASRDAQKALTQVAAEEAKMIGELKETK